MLYGGPEGELAGKGCVTVACVQVIDRVGLGNIPRRPEG